jgi:hypothetical protein
MQNVFVCDLVATIKVCQGDVHNTFYDNILKFIDKFFCAFKSLFGCNNENIQMQWIPYLNIGVQHLTFKIFGQHIRTIH